MLFGVGCVSFVFVDWRSLCAVVCHVLFVVGNCLLFGVRCLRFVAM